MTKKNIKSSIPRSPIAIIGMGCIFPESRNLKEFWHLIFNGIDAIQPIPEESHWQLKDYFDSDPARKDHTYCSRGGFIPPIAFDPLSYGIPPNNIEATDTAQLLGLEVARMALADAGYPAGDKTLQEKTVNVILGVTGTQELVIPLGARLGHPLWKKALEASGVSGDKKEEILKRLDSSYVQWQENSFPGLLGNVVAGRIANRLDLSGTNSVNDAACASSLSAMHTAIMELETGRCDMSITGGVDCLNDIFMHMCFSKTGVLSHTSDAKPFSKDADGTVLGEGIGMLVLKRLKDAEQDKDRIYAVIKGMGTSSDGRTSAIYAPEAKGQVKALKEAYEIAGIDPATVDLIEAHGTGTRVGDKVEFTALKQHFGSFDTPNTTAIGSVKSMIGHTKASAGAAGIIKTALALHNKVIPPTLKAEQPDPELNINESAFYLNATSKPWIPKQLAKSESRFPRRSGISAFGFGGSNFHAVLEEYRPEKSHVSWDGSVQILAFSAKDTPTLITKINNFNDSLASFSKTDQGEYQQAMGWLAFESRQQFSVTDELRLLALVSKNDDIGNLIEKALAALEGEPKPKAPTAPIFFGSGKPTGKLGFVFPGQGSQYTGMAKDIISLFPEAMEALSISQSCMAKLHAKTKNPIKSLNDYIYPLPVHVQDQKIAEEQLRQTQIAQPAIGAISLAMTKILKRFKISPEMTCGHSFGELSALYAAGWIDQESFLNLSSARGIHMAAAGKQSGDVGSMLAIQAPIEKIESLIKDEALDLILANRNSHTQGVLSGSTQEIERAKEICRKKKIRAVKLPVAAAFHSRLVQDATIPFKACVKDNRLTPSKIDVLSNTSGQTYPRDDKGIKDLLGNQLMHPVNFIDNIETMHKNGVSTFIEIGPKAVLTGLVNSILKDKNILACSLDSSGGKKTGIYDLGLTLCTIAAQGFSVDLTQWEDHTDKPVSKKMTLMLSGANPKPVPDTDIPVSPAQAAEKEINIKKTLPVRQSQTAPKADESKTQGSNMTPSPRFLKEPAASPSQDAILLVHKGLEAMQQLQEQTARAHEKFLETQTQASKTLASMMEQTRGFVSPIPMETRVQQTAPLVQDTVVSQSMASGSQAEITQAAQPLAAPSAPAEPVQPVPPGPVVIAELAPEPPAELPVQKVLYETVSRLTGFPVEMLEPDMDIESDLGIDSIKKVEIISELEKQLPGGKGLSTEHLSSVRTLADICKAMASGSDMPQAAAESKQKPEDSPVPAPQTTEGPARIFTVLTEIISELTGFPVEMLEPDMNLESDLGIDSIKRVEILSKLEQELDDLNNISPDDMGSLNTIQDIANFLTPSGKTVSTETHKKKTQIHATSESIDNTLEDTQAGTLLRQEIVLKEYPTNQIRFYNGAKIDIPSAKTVYLTQDHAGLAACFKKEFENLGIQAKILNLNQDDIPDLPDAAGLILLPDAFEHPDDLTAKSFLSRAFSLANKNAGHLMASANEKGAFFTTISFSGGHFGFKTPELTANPIYGGLAGLAKTADLEWKDVLCRALDLPGDIKQCKKNAEAAVALMMTHGAVEMGLDGETCCIPTLEAKEITDGIVHLTSEDVVIITGGAKGVTAECAVYLAREFNPKIVLLGRSPAPFQEPDWLLGISEPGDIKKLILTHEFKGQKVRPTEIESRYQTLISNRTIQENLNRINEFSPQVQYISVDIRDTEQVKAVFSDIRQTLGNISAIIHGAGVLEDKLIAEKRLDQFERVFNTKVLGLEALISASETDPLKYLVLFSSIAARLGNTGQCDYAMANEVLNKFAQAQALKQPDCRFLSINWGPWAGGMVNDGLKKEFSKRGVELIPLEQGATQLLKEMGNPDKHCVEVVIGAALNPPSPTKKPIQTKALDQVFGTQSSPIINSHKIAHDPVVPFALMADLLAHAAEKNNPGLYFAGLDDLRLLKGIVPNKNEISVQVDLGKCTPKDSKFHTSGSLNSMDAKGNKRLHANANILLKNDLPEPPALSKAAFMDLRPYGMSIEQAYKEILFHGKELQCITAVNGVSQKGIEVISTPAPGIDQWYANPHSKNWTIDPMMLDAAFQAAILWTHETRKAVCLPSYVANLKVYTSYKNRTGNIRILFTVNHESQHKVQGYFTFLDDTDTVIASIMGFEATIDTKLMDKFKVKPLFPREKILAFAQGKPSHAFGEAYKVFDKDRQIARLPRPPYFFMDRILKADHPQWEMKPGQWIESEYDIPASEWYFNANRTESIPFCILLEIALQPCGWLAAYAGSALQSDERLHFRNLGGKATLLKNISKDSGTLVMRSRMTDVSKAGGMIIQNFDMEVLNNGRMVYQGTTNFGFFTKEALSNQVGIRNSRFTSDPTDNYTPVVFDEESPITPSDKTSSPNSGMPAKSLLMIDQIDCLDLTGGLYGNGYIKATKKVNPKEWFFDAHFYQDPVCPGSLGVESFLQMLRFYLTQKYDTQHYEVAMVPGNTHEWAYRGQIIPTNKQVEIHAHIKETSHDSSQYLVTADGALSVDGICIYEMKDFGIQFMPITQSADQHKIDQLSEDN